MNDELPEGWATCQVQEYFRSFSGGTPDKGTPAYWGGNIPWLSSGDIKANRIHKASKSITKGGLKNSSAKLCRPGSTVIVVRSGILKHTLPVAVLECEASINQDIKCFDSGNDELNEWLALALQTAAKDILALNREGTTVQSVKYETLTQFKLRVPPLNEQRRIAAKLDALLAKVRSSQERLDKIPTIIKRFRQAILAAACSGRLTAEWRDCHVRIDPASKLLDRLRDLRRPRKGGRDRPSSAQEGEDLPTTEVKLPGTWELCRVDDIARVCLGGTPSRKEPSYWDGEVPWVSSGEVANARIKITKERITKAGLENSNAKVYPKGSVLIAMIGEGKTRGQSALLEIAACTNQNVAGLLFESDGVVPQYVGFWALGEYDRTRAVGRGGNQPALNGQKVRALSFPLAPTGEQREIVARLEALLKTADRLESRFAAADKYVDELTRSILAKAFRGELVPTEAELARSEGREYETSEELLRRVRRETPAGTTNARPKRGARAKTT